MNNSIKVCLTFDFDAESAQIRQLEEPGRVSKGQFSVRRGIPRILSLLKKHDIQSTFFTCGWVAEKYSKITREITENGHEIAAHGYLHEYLDTVSIYEEEEVFKRTDCALKEITEDIRGFRAPYWKLSSNTLNLIAKTGYIFDSSLFDDDHPYIFNIPNSSKKIVEFPVEWFLDDWIIFEEKQSSPTAAFDIWKSQFDAFLEMEDIPEIYRVFQMTFHPACIGHAYRIHVIDQLISYMKKTANLVKFEKMGDVAEKILI
ncbi:MAG: polysaccharide deacetylase family protein [Candidatus Hodarchaeota archaeon]